MNQSFVDQLKNPNPSLTAYPRDAPAPVLPLREEPDLLTWLEGSSRLLEEKDANQGLSTVEEEELSALMGEKEDYSKDDEQEEGWDD